jgi:hypothetical protein
MYEEVFKISMIMVTAAILTMPSLVLQLSHAQTNADFKDTILNIHNKVRAEVGVPPLTWSSNLAADALNYAKHLTTLGLGPDDIVPHDQNTNEGENLAWGTKAGFSATEHVNGWVSEKVEL